MFRFVREKDICNDLIVNINIKFVKKHIKKTKKNSTTNDFFPYICHHSFKNKIILKPQKKIIMKKSLIAMALMFGAVVFVMPSCGGDNSTEETKKCTVKVEQADGTKVASLDYPDPVEEAKKPTSLGDKDAAVAANKGGSYTCE